jgi:outer membrane protein, adhesin transport system
MRARPPVFRPAPHALAACLVLALSAALAQARCVDESLPETDAASPPGGAAPAPDPRAALNTLVRQALERSHQLGAARLLAEAAEDDIAEARAARGIQASLGLGLGPGGSQNNLGTETSDVQLRTTLGVSQLLWDGGRTRALVDWRTQLAESARQGHLSLQEQVALNAVSLALERSRFRQHVQVYGQYVRKMGCLVDALETIVRADRGRASELVQARKSLQQAELAKAQAHSQARQVDVRLRRLVGDTIPSTEGVASLLLGVEALDTLVADVERSADIAALTAQVAAAGRLADAAAAAGGPQLSWNLSGSHAAGRGGTQDRTRNGSYSVGIALNVPLLNPGADPARDSARKRARAAELQRQEALEQRRWRVAELHEQTTSSFDRLRRVGGVLRDSDQLRGFTLQQWQQLGRRSLFDVMNAEAEHYNLRIAYVNALHDGQQLNANLLSLGRGVTAWLR